MNNTFPTALINDFIRKNSIFYQYLHRITYNYIYRKYLSDKSDFRSDCIRFSFSVEITFQELCHALILTVYH